MLGCQSTFDVDCSDALISWLTKGIFFSFPLYTSHHFRFHSFYSFLVSQTLFSLPLTGRQTKKCSWLFNEIESISFPNSSQVEWNASCSSGMNLQGDCNAYTDDDDDDEYCHSKTEIETDSAKKWEVGWKTKISSDIARNSKFSIFI